MGSGNMSESAVDFVGGDGGLTYTRYYNSNPLAPDLGRYGWQNEYASRHIYPLNRSLKSSLPKATFRASSTSSVALLNALPIALGPLILITAGTCVRADTNCYRVAAFAALAASGTGTS